MPDDGRFGVIWMSRTALEAAYDMEGAFNEALLSLGRDTNEAAVIDAVDRLLEPYGGLGAYGLKDQGFEPIRERRDRGTAHFEQERAADFPGGGRFSALHRGFAMVQAEREQIGLMKAFGYTDFEVGFHYFKMILVDRRREGRWQAA